jgi:hypothetical protein
MARQNPADDSCVGVLFRGLLIVAVVVVALVGWLS